MYSREIVIKFLRSSLWGQVFRSNLKSDAQTQVAIEWPRCKVGTVLYLRVTRINMNSKLAGTTTSKISFEGVVALKRVGLVSTFQTVYSARLHVGNPHGCHYSKQMY